MTLPPAEVGAALEDVDTPALIIEMDALERNLSRMAQASAAAGVRLRPHAKTHKCAVLGRRQMALGAVGVCCQKVSEAEAMIRGGVGDVLVSNQVVGAPKVAKLASLAHEARIGVCVDHPDNVAALSAAAGGQGVTLGVLVEIDVGAGRCGVAPGPAAAELADRVAGAPGLRLEGLQAYQGRAQHLRSAGEREAAIGEAVHLTRLAMEALAARGLPCETISGAGTGTYALEAASGVYNELQTGSYVFMDADYARNRKPDGSPYDVFEHSLFVLSTVMSTPREDLAVVDAGLKALSVDSGMPDVRGPLSGAEEPGTATAGAAGTYAGASDEHGKLNLAGTNRRYRLGEKVLLVPGHCDPTVNLYDWYVCVRESRVEALWPIAARGAIR